MGTRIRWILALTFLVLSSTDRLQGQVGSGSENISALLANAYTKLGERSPDAIKLFEEVVRIDSTNILARRQLGSLYVTAGRTEDALSQFTIANTLLRSDTTDAQIGYLLASLGRTEEAQYRFDKLRSSSDRGIRAKSRGSSVILSSINCVRGSEWWGKVYAAPYYDSRFENAILSASFHGGYYLTDRRWVSVYGTLGISRDTRSSDEVIPEIFSDNYAIAGAGLRFEQFDGLITEVQGGLTVDLLDVAGTRSLKGDFRATTFYGTGWFPDLVVPDDVTFRAKPWADFYSSIGYYSRYHNAIGYGQARVGVRAVELMYSALDVYVRGDVAGDTERKYFNNVVEASVGLRIVPDHRWGISLLAEYHRGRYWDSGLSVPAAGREYESTRLFIVLDRNLCF